MEGSPNISGYDGGGKAQFLIGLGMFFNLFCMTCWLHIKFLVDIQKRASHAGLTTFFVSFYLSNQFPNSVGMRDASLSLNLVPS